jgi:predicted ATPase
MLIEFSVANFRSFRERQTLSMVAAPKLRKGRNAFKTPLSGEKFPDLLKVCAVYGPNAAGKSNLLLALSTLGLMADLSPSAQAAALPVAPFALDPALALAPSSFDVHFIQEGLRYQFELAATRSRIVHERLVAFPQGNETLLYERHSAKETEDYTFGPELEGGEALHQTWRKLTPPTLLFLSQAVANSSVDLTQLRRPFTWLSRSVDVLMRGMRRYSRIAQELVADGGSTHAASIAAFLRDVDVPVSAFRAESVDPTPFPLNLLAHESSSIQVKTTLTHRTALGEAELSFDDQSEGTKNLIGFFVPWSLKGYGDRSVLAVDELDSSLHPKIVAALIDKHLDSGHPTQLIFTTHDTHLMDTKLLRRDQIWIVERDANGATQLRSVHDFEGRESEDVEKRYYEGRYRGLPLLKGG